jgi:hypothetical protein
MRPLQSCFALAGLVVFLAGGALGLEPGQPAPDFDLQATSGATHRLSDYRGQLVLVALVGWG